MEGRRKTIPLLGPRLFPLDRSRSQLLGIRSARQHKEEPRWPLHSKGNYSRRFTGSNSASLEVATVLDAKAIREGLHPHYGANASADEVMALARANNIDTQRSEHPKYSDAREHRQAAGPV